MADKQTGLLMNLGKRLLGFSTSSTSCCAAPAATTEAKKPTAEKSPLKKEAVMIEAPKVHVHMSVSDLEKSRAFYEKFLGVAPVKVKPGYVKFLPGFGPLNLALSQASPSSEGGHVNHMGIQVESQDIVVREMERVRAAGLPVREEFSVDCCHANQDKFWVEDPDGVDWEVYVLNHDIEEAAPTDGGACCATTAPQATVTKGLTITQSAATSCCR